MSYDRKTMAEILDKFGFDQISSIFDEMKVLTGSSTYHVRINNLSDDTGIRIERYLGKDGLLYGEDIDTFLTRVSREHSVVMSFEMTQNGLVGIDFSSQDLTIGNKIVRGFGQGQEVNYHGSLMPEESKNVFRGASRNLVAWVAQMVTDGKYIQPPVVFTPSASYED